MNNTPKTTVETSEKEQTKPVLRKVEARRWNKADGLLRQGIQWGWVQDVFKPWRADRRYLDDYRADFRDVVGLLAQQQVFLDPRAIERVRPWVDVPATLRFDELPSLSERSLQEYQQRFERHNQECLQVYRPAALQYERPHQGEACESQPPRVAYASLPSRPPLPDVIDPDGWIGAWEGKVMVRKVRRDTSISIDERRYYMSKALIGQEINVRVEAATGSFIIEHEGKEVKRIAIGGTGKGMMSFEHFVDYLCTEARDGRTRAQTLLSQLSLPVT